MGGAASSSASSPSTVIEGTGRFGAGTACASRAAGAATAKRSDAVRMRRVICCSKKACDRNRSGALGSSTVGAACGNGQFRSASRGGRCGRNAHPAAVGYVVSMRRARFYFLVLGLTLLPQVVAASDLVRWLADHGELELGLSLPGVLVLLNLPMLAEILRRKKSARLPRFFAALLQTPWTAWWLGSLFYAILRAFWTLAHLGAAP